jgi:hypothetical protein
MTTTIKLSAIGILTFAAFGCGAVDTSEGTAELTAVSSVDTTDEVCVDDAVAVSADGVASLSSALDVGDKDPAGPCQTCWDAWSQADDTSFARCKDRYPNDSGKWDSCATCEDKQPGGANETYNTCLKNNNCPNSSYPRKLKACKALSC